MTGLDKAKINSIIENASKGSKFYAKQKENQARWVCFCFDTIKITSKFLLKHSLYIFFFFYSIILIFIIRIDGQIESLKFRHESLTNKEILLAKQEADSFLDYLNQVQHKTSRIWKYGLWVQKIKFTQWFPFPSIIIIWKFTKIYISGWLT